MWMFRGIHNRRLKGGRNSYWSGPVETVIILSYLQNLILAVIGVQES